MDSSQRDSSLEELQSKKQDVLPHLINSLQDTSKVWQFIKCAKSAVEFLPVIGISEIEEKLLRHIMPNMVLVLQKVYKEINLKASENDNDILNMIKTNLKMSLAVIEICSQIINYLTQYESVHFNDIQSLPTNISNILVYTFEHCKYSQKTYNSNYKSIEELVVLFRKTQNLHSILLYNLESKIIFSRDNECYILEVLNLIHEMCRLLSGVNTKCMADSWKSFTSLIEKHKEDINDAMNLTPYLRTLSEEINNYLKSILTASPADLKTASYNIKIAGFLIKVIIKLFTVADNNMVDKYFEELVRFCLIIYSYPSGFFCTNGLSDGFISTYNSIVFLNTEAFFQQLISDRDFINKFCNLNENSPILKEHSFGFISFSNEILKTVCSSRDILSTKLDCIQFLHLMFSATKLCYSEFFWDYNAMLYDDFVTNMAVTILLFPHDYEKVERILLENVCQEKIWTSMMAIDCWILVLQNCSVATVKNTFQTLLSKLLEINFGKFSQRPSLIFLKILLRRMFKILPTSISNEFISAKAPNSNMAVWKLLDLNFIPLSQRFQIEFVLNDVYDKIENLEQQNCCVNNFIEVIETFEMLSSVDFNALQINTSRLAPYVIRLWSFNASEISANNNFYKYFISNLLKITKAIIGQLVTENLILVLNQLKHLLNEPLFKLHVCDILSATCRRNISNYTDKQTLHGLIIATFQLIFGDCKNPVITQNTLHIIKTVYEDDNFRSISKKLSPQINNLLINYDNEMDAGEFKSHFEYLETIKNAEFKHQCLRWSECDQPQSKRIKLDDEIDEIVSEFKRNVKRIIQSKNNLTPRHFSELKGVICKLDMLF